MTAIEIVVGLPHLADGALLARARHMQQPVLISANALSRWRGTHGQRDWAGWRLDQLRNAAGLRSLDLDSAGFTLMARYGGFPWSIADYMALAAAYPFRRVAAADYCCEREIARDREEVRDRISRTIRTNRECRDRAADLGILDRLMPVVQGRTPDDYERCVEALQRSLLPGTIVGVGSMCRREIAGPEGLVAVVERLDRILPTDVRLHGFGVKGSALPYLRPFGARVASIDSQAYGIAARQDARRRGVRKSDALVADHMEAWTRRQLARRAEPSRFPPSSSPAEPDPPPADRWEVAIARARAEIRTLIETGDLDHDGITAAWVESWAADLLHAD